MIAFNDCLTNVYRSRVRVVKSYRAGMGKTLFAKNMRTALLQMRDEENLEIENEQFVTLPLYEKYLDMDGIVEVFLNYTNTSSPKYGRIFHIDIAHEVYYLLTFVTVVMNFSWADIS